MASVEATILRVNNMPGSSAPYNTLISAHDAAVDGDTIYVEGSSNGYGSLIITKRLIFIGPGYFLSENPNTPTSLPAIVNDFKLNQTINGDPLSGAAGTEIRGLSFTQSGGTQIEVDVNNVVVAQCVVNFNVWFKDDDISGTQVIQNYFYGSGIGASSTIYSSNNLTFANNIVEGAFYLAPNSSGMILHNLFLGSNFDVQAFSGEIRSNIITTSNVNNVQVSVSGGTQLSHNTAGNGQLGSIDNNNTATPAQLFVGASNNSTDGQYQLLPTATATTNNAHDGTDRGPFGGSLPYSLSGVGNIPAIIFMDVPNSASPSSPFSVTIRAISGN